MPPPACSCTKAVLRRVGARIGSIWTGLENSWRDGCDDVRPVGCPHSLRVVGPGITCRTSSTKAAATSFPRPDIGSRIGQSMMLLWCVGEADSLVHGRGRGG